MKEEQNKYTANYIRSLRQEAGLNQGEVADILGIKRATYSHYETGRLQPSAEKLALLAEYYQVSMDSLCRFPKSMPDVRLPGSKKSIKRPKKSKLQAVTQEDLALVSAYHHLSGKEQRAVWKMMMEMAEG